MEEISQHVLDLLMNSYEAGATEIHLKISEDSEQDLFSIAVKDNGRGMDKKTLEDAANPFVTGRKTRRVGLGLALLKALAESCNGHMSLESEPGLGCKVLVELQKSHWDCPPLGNMAGTIIAFLCSSNSVRLIYEHHADGRYFSLDTKEIQSLVHPMPINNIKVLGWLKSYVSDGLKVLEKRGDKN